MPTIKLESYDDAWFLVYALRVAAERHAADAARMEGISNNRLGAAFRAQEARALALADSIEAQS